MKQMKRMLFPLTIALVLTAAVAAGQKTPEPETTKEPRERNRSFDGMPLDPFKEGERVRVKELAQKNYQELKDATTELAELSQKLNEDVADGGEHVISARIFDRLDKIEKLTRRIRDKAKGSE